MSDDHNHEYTPPPRYHLSGEMGTFPPLQFVAAAFAGVLMGLLIGVGDLASGDGRLAVAIPLMGGMGLGYACYWFARQVNCRNAWVVQAAALLGCSMAVYGLTIGLLSFATHLAGCPLPPVSAISLFCNPALVVSTASAVLNGGFISRGGFPLSSNELLIHWGVQALCLLVPGVVLARIMMLRQVYCEDCRAWLDIGRKKLIFPTPTDGMDRHRLEEGDLSVLLEQALHRPIHASRPPYVRLDYVLCDTCGNTGVFRVMSVTPKKTQWVTPLWHPLGVFHNEKNISEEGLTPLMQLTPEAAHQVGQLRERDRETKAVNSTAIVKPTKPLKSTKRPVPPRSIKGKGTNGSA